MRQNRLVMQSLSFIICILLFLSYFPSSLYGAVVICEGKTLPQVILDGPASLEEKQYLGLKDLKSFPISQIPAKLILIEIFSFYCPICHKQAPIANKLYKFIQQDPELSKNIKMMGIGAGNNSREVDAYKANFRVSFPLFCDPHYKIHKELGEPRTPFTILANRNGKILLTHSGVIEDTDEFMSKIRKILKQQ